MAYNEFAANLVADIADVERALLFGHPGVEHDLQQQVAQFLAEQDVVGVVNGLNDFVGLFDEVFADGCMRLLTSPRDSLRAPGADFITVQRSEKS